VYVQTGAYAVILHTLMRSALVALLAVSFVLSWFFTRLMRVVAPWMGFVDKPGGRKIHVNPKPLGGGVAIFWSLALPILAGLAYVHWYPPPELLLHRLGENLGRAYWDGIRQQTPMALAMLGATFALHVMGLCDDRKAMGPYSKLFIQLAVTAAVVVAMDLRITVLDQWLGRWPSIIVTVLWIGMITNAFNFLDNMDGLSAGVAAVCATAFLIAAASIGQWFVAAALAILLGAIMGFLWHNFPPAAIFMGDSGSLIIGFMMGILTVRTTYLPANAAWANEWYKVLAPVIVLALPLYDLLVVSAIRLSRGKSPFVGDTNHFSHRLVARGMSRRTAVLCLYLVSASTSIAAIILPHVTRNFALLIFAQTILILGVVALLEQHPLPPSQDEPPRRP